MNSWMFPSRSFRPPRNISAKGSTAYPYTLNENLQSQEKVKLAKTVFLAFQEFMRDHVNIDPDVSTAAKISRQNLLENINEFKADDDFFDLCKEFNINFGSFARKTKCRELDDIDLMVGINGNNATYKLSDPWHNVRIYASTTDKAQKQCTNEDGTLNSTKVSNKFKKKLESVREYSRSEIQRNGEVIRLNLKSKVWSFDVVPCFRTKPEPNKKSYYLIPNGKGNWKKTAPDVDRESVTRANQAKDHLVLDLVRICKKWNMVKKTKTIPSYLLETMVINFADSQTKLHPNLIYRFMGALNYIATHISDPVDDMKEIQGNINSLDPAVILELSCKASNDLQKAFKACEYERSGNHESAINIWRTIFGQDFPQYG